MPSTEFLKVQSVIAEQLGIKRDLVKEDTHLENDLGADDFDRVEIVMTLEDEFGLEISDKEYETWTTVAQMVEGLAKLIQEKQGAAS